MGATGPPAGANALETSAAEPVGTLTYTYDSRDQLTRISGATSTSYTYDANGNRLTQTQTRGAGTTTTRYHWNAQDQLVSVAQDSGSGPEILARYRYNAANLRAEKLLGNAGLSAATQGSAGAFSPLAYERIQWDGLHARRNCCAGWRGEGPGRPSYLAAYSWSFKMASNTAVEEEVLWHMADARPLGRWFKDAWFEGRRLATSWAGNAR